MTLLTEATSTRDTFIRRLLIVIAFGGLVGLVWWLRDLLLLVFGAVLVAVIFRSLADPLHRRFGLSHAVSLALAIAIMAVIAVIVVVFFGGEILAQARTLQDTLPVAWADLQQRLSATDLGQRVLDWVKGFAPTDDGVLSGAGQIVSALGSSLADLILVLMGGVYLASQPVLYRDGLLMLLPKGARKLTGEALADSGRALRQWLGGQVISMGSVGVMATLGLWALDVPAALALGVIAAIFDFVPIVGPLVAAIPALLLGLTVSPMTAVYVGVLYLVAQQIEGNVISPLVQQRKVDLPPALLLFALVGIGTMFGIEGIVLAAPLTVVIYVMVKLLYVREALNTPTSVPGEVTEPAGHARRSRRETEGLGPD